MSGSERARFDIPATAACAAALCFWSVGPIFIKYLTGYLDLWTQNLLRYCAACVFWLPLLFHFWKTNRLDHRVWLRALPVFGVNVVMQSLSTACFYYIEPAFMDLLVKSSVFWIAAFSVIFFAEERGLVRSKRFWSGLVMSVTGLIGVLVFKEGFGGSGTRTGIVLALSASFMWAVYTIVVKLAFRDIDVRIGFSVTSIYMVAGLGLLAMVFGEVKDCLRMPAWPWACVGISGLAAIGLAHVLYYAAVKRIGATIPSLMLLSSPFAVFAISRVVFGESLNSMQWIFGVVLLMGAGLSIWSQEHLGKASADMQAG